MLKHTEPWNLAKQVARQAFRMGKQKKIRLLLVDDHEVVRQGLSCFLGQCPDIEIVGEASDGSSAITQAKQLLPDVVIMDILMPGMTGIEATRILSSEVPEVHVIALSMNNDAATADAARKAGALAYCCKTDSPNILIQAIRAAV
jgi:NarL family two-component system response regulator LiaR